MTDQSAVSPLQVQRKGGIGGSDAGAILGLNPYKTGFDVWLEKTGQRPPQPMNEAMWWGLALEDIVARRYAQDRKVTLYHPDSLYYHPTEDFLLASPDRIVMEGSRPERGLEIKTASAYGSKGWGEVGTDQIPPTYLAQVIHYMAVLGMERWDVAVLIGGQDFRIYSVQRDRELEVRFLDKLRAWWQEHIVKGEPPPMRGPNVDAWVKHKFPNHAADLIPATTEADLLASLVSRYRLEIEQKAEELASLESKIKYLIGEHAGIEGKTWRATWKKASDTERVDWHAVALGLAAFMDKEAPGTGYQMLADLHEKHLTVSPGSRRFLFRAFGG